MSKIYQNFIEVEEVIKLRKGTYTDLTTFSDARSLLFRFEKEGQWESLPLQSLHKTVKGFKQGFARIYDTDKDAFIFQMKEEVVNLDVETVLSKKKQALGWEI